MDCARMCFGKENRTFRAIMPDNERIGPSAIGTGQPGENAGARKVHQPLRSQHSACASWHASPEQMERQALEFCAWDDVKRLIRIEPLTDRLDQGLVEKVENAQILR